MATRDDSNQFVSSGLIGRNLGQAGGVTQYQCRSLRDPRKTLRFGRLVMFALLLGAWVALNLNPRVTEFTIAWWVTFVATTIAGRWLWRGKLAIACAGAAIIAQAGQSLGVVAPLWKRLPDVWEMDGTGLVWAHASLIGLFLLGLALIKDDWRRMVGAVRLLAWAALATVQQLAITFILAQVLSGRLVRFDAWLSAFDLRRSLGPWLQRPSNAKVFGSVVVLVGILGVAFGIQSCATPVGIWAIVVFVGTILLGVAIAVGSEPMLCLSSLAVAVGLAMLSCDSRPPFWLLHVRASFAILSLSVFLIALWTWSVGRRAELPGKP